MKYHPQCEVSMSRGDKNDNGKRKPVIHISGNKARKLSKKKVKLEKLHEVPERTLRKEGLQNWNSIGISEQRILELHHDEEI
jgi:hypothetical protein